jgi:hypothetical protein
VFGLLAAMTVITPTLAQQHDSDMAPAAGEAAPVPTPDEFTVTAEEGIRFRASLGVTEYYDDNIFATQFEEKHDLVTLISPAVSAESKWAQHSLNFGASADIYRNKNFRNEDAEDARVYGNGRYDIGESSNLFGGLSWTRSHEDRSSPDQIVGITPTIFHVMEGFGGYALDNEKYALRLGATYADYDYDDVPTLEDTVNNDDRDREQASAGLRLGYAVSERYEFFAQAALDNRRYRLDTDDNGFIRDSDGYRLAFGMVSSWSHIESEVLVGYLRQQYDDERFATVSVPDFGVRISTRKKPWSVSGYLDRTLEETTLANASSYLSSRLGVSVRQPVSARTTLNAAAGFTREDFQDITRKDELTFIGAGVQHRVSRGWRIQGDMDRTERDSTAELADFSKTRVFLRLIAATGMPPLATAGDAAGPPAVGGFNGLYAGLLGGRASGTSKVTGRRGPFGDTTELTAEYGNSASAGTVMAGYGRTWGRWYIGLEAEYQPDGSAWRFEREPDQRVIEAKLKDKYGLGARLGYVAAPYVLLFSRFGAARGEYETSYRFQDVVADRTVDLDGVEIAIGNEITLARHLNLRLEYLYSDFDGYGIDFGLTDKFSPREYTARLGLVGTWGGGGNDDQTATAVAAPDFSGFHWGVRGGFGVLESGFEGPRGPPAQRTAELSSFTGAGPVWGLFGGIGSVWGRLYAGLEADVQAESMDWSFEREPDVREVALRKRWTFGIGPRLGFLLRDNVMLFGRAELVGSEFEIRSLLNTEFDSVRRWVSGGRFGLGTEIMYTGGMFWSMDYTYAKYDSEEFGINRPDVFEIEDGVFRLAVGYRF